MRLALFASGTGSNVQAIIQAVEKGDLQAELACLICDQPSAPVIEKARTAGLPVFSLTYKAAGGKAAWEQAVVTYLKDQAVDILVLAGFMRIIGPDLLAAYPQAILNIHPSLLPKFPGKAGIKEAYEAGVSQTGVTIHWVDQEVDTGPIIAQEAITVSPDWTLDQLEAAIHQVEHRLYPATLQTLINDKLSS